MTTTETQLIRVGHSPDPDDAFMFYALAKEKVPMRGFRVEHVIEDIESLNQRALKNAELEVTGILSCLRLFGRPICGHARRLKRGR